MKNIPHLPKKVKLLLELSFPLIEKLLPRKGFIGGRIGYSKEEVFKWLLVKKVTNWSYRTITDLTGISHQVFIYRNQQFLERQVYQQFFSHLISLAVKKKLIRGVKVALDSSFVSTYSKKRETGSEGWNEFKKHFGFKLHVLLDVETRFPIALVITNGLAHDGTLAIPLLKKAKRYLKKQGYVLAKSLLIHDLIDRIVMKGNTNEVEVMGHIPINHLNIGYELISRNSQDITQQFIPFSFKLRLPPLRKARIIIERNRLGQIEQARSPFIKTHHFKI